MGVPIAKYRWIGIFAFAMILLCDVPVFSCTVTTNQECATAANVSYSAGIPACVQGCTDNATAGITRGALGDCDFMPFPTVWYEFTSLNTLTLLQVDMTSSEIDGARISVFEGPCLNPVTVDCYTGINGTIQTKNIRLESSTRYYVAVSSNDGTTGAFNLCLNISENPSTCNDDNSLVVKSTSMGSPKAGPFKPNEEVEFCYTINNYVNNSCTYLHSIIPEFGNGWSPASFNADGSPVNVTQALQTQGIIYILQLDPVCEGDPAGSWNWYPDGVITYNLDGNNPNNFFSGDPVGAGWSFLNSYDPTCEINFPDACCTNPTMDPGESFGDNDIYACSDRPNYVWEVCFKLTTNSAANCSTMNDCSVRVKTYGDGETGRYDHGGCRYDEYTEYDAMLTCGPAPDVSAPASVELCKGKTADFMITSSDPTASFFWVNTATNQTGFSSTNPGIFNETFPIEGNYTFEIYATNGCLSTPQIVNINVKDNFTVDIVQNPNVACANDNLTLNAVVVGGTGPFTYLWDDPTASSSTSIVVSDPTVTSYKVIVSDGSCDAEQTININFAPVSTATISGTDNICDGDNASLNVSFTGTGPWTFTYEDQLGNSNVITTSSANYTLSVNPSVDATYSITQLTDDNNCSGTFSGTASVTVAASQTPVFSFDLDYCRTDPIFTLPTSSDNGVIGAWSVATINPASIVGTSQDIIFTPVNSCDQSLTLKVTVKEAVTPSFSIPASLCKTDAMYTLPLVSNNGVSGTWNVPFIDPATETNTVVNLEFTPNDLDCTNKYFSSIVINPAQQPIFNLSTELCSDLNSYVLPVQSDNGIDGTWNYTTIDLLANCGQTLNLVFTATADCTENFMHNLKIDCELVPTFNLTLDYCETDPAFVLSTLSDNNISGNWSIPTIDPQNATTPVVSSVFTPTDDCAATFTANFNIAQEIDPIFSFETSLCKESSSYTLPTISDNNYSGTWSVPLIDPSSGTSFINSVFTPDDNCVKSYTAVFNITDAVVPSFNINENICNTDAAFTLPTVSQNSVSGTWSVPVIDPATSGSTVVSVFTPSNTSNTCATNYTATINIQTEIAPIFSFETNVCSQSNMVSLPTVSDNNITGTWSISSYDPSTSGASITSVFTPDATLHSCAAEYTANISIITPLEPIFSFEMNVCSQSNMVSLPTVSDNNITGTWSISSYDPSTSGASVTSVFTPDPALHDCAAEYTANITIVNPDVPVFSFETSLCSTDGIIVLPTQSDNGLNGSWSQSTIYPNLSGSTATSVFTPTDDCVESYTANFTISDAQIPTFSFEMNLCSTDASLTLPTQSDNGLNGTWSVPTIDPSNAGNAITSIFTPADDCVENFTANINISNAQIPSFSFETNLCSIDGVLTLPTQSDNAFNGSWSIASIDPSTSGSTVTSTFTPTDNCVESFTANFNITAAPLPSFSVSTSLCNTDASLTLPTNSDNNIAGMWSIPTIDPATMMNGVTSIFTPNDDCAQEVTLVFSIDNAINLEFSLPQEICKTAADLILPTTDNNGNTGTWNTPVISPSSETNTSVNLIFTPTDNCINNFTTSITITEELAPVFSFKTEFCKTDQAFTFPLVSDNNISGSWAVPTFDPNNTGANTINNVFTPSDDCASGYTELITINENVTPEFSLPTDLCYKESVLNLPTISDNNVSGFWNISSLDPSLYNNESVALEFTPTDDCANNYVTDIFVNNDALPSFVVQTNFCQTDAAVTLPLISQEGYEGTWSVAQIDPATIGANQVTSIFTPNDPQACVSDLTLTFSVVASVMPEFSLPSFICHSAGIYTLPSLSDNAISGVWTPAQIDPMGQIGNTINLNFKPDSDCAEEVNTTLTVTESKTIAFNLPTDFCANDPVYTLPLESSNGILGTWSTTEINPNSEAGNTLNLTFTPDDSDCIDPYQASFEVHLAPDFYYTENLELCESALVDFNEISISDLNGTGATISYHSATPADGTNLIDISNFPASSDQTIYILAVTPFCSVEYPVELKVSPVPVLASVDPVSVCEGVDYNLLDLSITDVNSLPVNISYHDGSPANSTNILSSNTLAVAGDMSIYVLASANDCTTEMEIQFTLSASPELVFNETVELCQGEELILADLNIVDQNNTGSPISFYDGLDLNTANPIAGSITVNDDMIIYATAKAGDCEDIIPITIDVTPAPALMIGGQVVACQGTDLDLTTLNINDLNASGASWTFHTALPADASNELTNTVIQASSNVVIYAYANNQNCEDVLEIEISVTDMLNAGEDATVEICTNISDFYLNDFLSADAQNGVWVDISNSTLLNVNTSQFDVSNANVGNYNFEYIVASAGGSCPPDTASFIVEVVEAASAGQSTVIDQCIENDLIIDIASLLGGTPDADGNWTQVSGNVLNINDINAVDFSGEDSEATYVFQYEIEGKENCNNVSETVTIHLHESPSISVEKEDVSCAAAMNGSFEITAINSSDLLEFSYDGGATWTTDHIMNGLASDMYAVLIRNQMGCTIEENIEIGTGAEMMIEVLDIECDDAETPNDGDDDSHDIIFVVNTSGLSSSYNLYDDNTLIGTYDYGTSYTINILADGLPHSLTAFDQDVMGCNAIVDLGILEDCATPASCLISNVGLNYLACDDLDTDTSLDDQFSIEVNVSALNASTGWYLESDPSVTGTYNTDVQLGPFDINNGDFDLVIVDQSSLTCEYTLSIVAPETCSEATCDLSTSDLQIFDCENNDTADDNLDDYFNINFVLNSSNSNSEYTVLLDGNPIGNYNVGDQVSISNIAADGLDHIVSIFDINDTDCNTSFDVSQAACSECNETVAFVSSNEMILDCENPVQRVEIQTSSIGSYTWTGPNSSDVYSNELNPEFSVEGTYELVVVFSNGCEASLVLTVSVNDVVPEANAGSNQTINCRNSTVTLTGSSNNPDVNYAWYDENNNLISTEREPTIDKAGQYTLIVEDNATQCKSAPVIVEVIEDMEAPNMDLISSPMAYITCINSTVNIIPDGDLSNYEVSWTFNNENFTTDDITVTEAGIVNVQITNTINGCVQDTTLEIFEDKSMPIVMLSEPETLDCETTEILITSEGSTSGPDIAYQWYNDSLEILPDDKDDELLVTAPGQYFLEISNAFNGCSMMDSVNVEQDVDMPVIDAGAEVFISCDQTEVELTGVMLNSIDDYEVYWLDDQGIIVSQEITTTIENEGWYFLEIKNMKNSCSAVDSVLVKSDPNKIASADFEFESPLCFGSGDGRISVTAVESQSAELMYQLNGGTPQSEGVFENLSPGEYEVLVMTATGCSYSEIVVIPEMDTLVVDFSIDDTEVIELGDELQLNTEINFEIAEIAQIVWTNDNSLSCNDCLNPIATPTNDTDYEIEITTVNGCIIRSSVSVKVDREIKVYIPNAFSPNGDSNNDVFTVFGKKQIEEVLHMSVYNRWGNQVFIAEGFLPDDESEAWDGTYNDSVLENGVYVYRIKVLMKDGEELDFTGNVSIIR